MGRSRDFYGHVFDDMCPRGGWRSSSWADVRTSHPANCRGWFWVTRIPRAAVRVGFTEGTARPCLVAVLPIQLTITCSLILRGIYAPHPKNPGVLPKRLLDMEIPVVPCVRSRGFEVLVWHAAFRQESA